MNPPKEGPNSIQNKGHMCSGKCTMHGSHGKWSWLYCTHPWLSQKWFEGMGQSKVQKWTGKSITGDWNTHPAKCNIPKINGLEHVYLRFQTIFDYLGSYSMGEIIHHHVKYTKPFWNMQYSPCQLEDLCRISGEPGEPRNGRKGCSMFLPFETTTRCCTSHGLEIGQRGLGSPSASIASGLRMGGVCKDRLSRDSLCSHYGRGFKKLWLTRIH